jgi:hypothetical protein
VRCWLQFFGQAQPPEPDFEKVPFAPQRAIVYRAASPPTIDGKRDEVLVACGVRR